MDVITVDLLGDCSFRFLTFPPVVGPNALRRCLLEGRHVVELASDPVNKWKSSLYNNGTN